MKTYLSKHNSLTIYKILTVFFSIVLSNNVILAQNDNFQAGWYIIKSGAKVRKAGDMLYELLRCDLISRYWDSIAHGYKVKIDIEDYKHSMPRGVFNWCCKNNHVNEVVIAFMYDKERDIYYCIDTYGRMIYVKGKGSLEKINTPGKPARVKNEVKYDLEHSFHEGYTVWLTGFNAATKVATILLQGGQKVEISINDFFILPEYQPQKESGSWEDVEP
ncbi:MAG: hypothetical protein NZ529_11595 [Cytophagaceae bacterium]|nr:hypothetical protein [Cytophagaceae bacterium]MDW8457428.1 hypothetical protein [Cytophagaceae bacterium]